MTRSCVTCHSRKVKCDRSIPCSNCALAEVECVYPRRQITPRTRRRPAQSREVKLLARLEGLENLLKERELAALRSEPVESPSGHSSHSSEASSRYSTGSGPKWQGAHNGGLLRSQDGTSRYINSSPWSMIRNELDKVKETIADSISDDDDDDAGDTMDANSDSETRWFFGTPGQETILPTVSQATILWNLFKERVDPLVKIVHIPTLEFEILSAVTDPRSMSPAFECLLLAIYYGAVTSITPVECLSLLQEDRSELLQRYRSNFSSAISRANFLVTREVAVIQALVLYLYCRRQNNDDRVIWTLVGLTVRLSQGIGLHRDGTNFGLTPFETEMRRRLWWQICLQDTRSSEDYGCDTIVSEQIFDTKLPHNFNDADIHPAMAVLPPERIGVSEMTFCNLRYEAGSRFRPLKQKLKDSGGTVGSMTLDDRKRWLADFRRHFEKKYQHQLEESEPIAWVTIRATRMIMTKASMILFGPLQGSLPDELREMLFVACVEHLEAVHSFNTASRVARWRWFFETNMPWYVLSFTLNELCRSEPTPFADRAWAATSRVLSSRGFRNKDGLGRLWEPLMKMLSKAQIMRRWSISSSEHTPGEIEGEGFHEHMTPDYSRRQELESFLAEVGIDHSDVNSWKNLLRQIYDDDSTSSKPAASKASGWQFHSSIIGGTMAEF